MQTRWKHWDVLISPCVAPEQTFSEPHGGDEVSVSSSRRGRLQTKFIISTTVLFPDCLKKQKCIWRNQIGRREIWYEQQGCS